MQCSEGRGGLRGPRYLGEHGLAGAGGTVEENALDLLHQPAAVVLRLLQRQDHAVHLRARGPCKSFARSPLEPPPAYPGF
jgi:hypothetical protein